MNERNEVIGHDVLDNKYSLVRGVARRARQLQSGAIPLITTSSMKACRVAEDEIRSGHVRVIITPTFKTHALA